jgi:integrase
MPRPRWPYLQRHVTRHGKVVWYVRKSRASRVRLHAEFGTPDFADEYHKVLVSAEAVRAPKPAKAGAGSLEWLWNRYRETSAWSALSPATRRQRENIMLHVLKTSGHQPARAITRAAITAGRDRRSATPAQARNFLDAMRGLFRWATEAQLIPSNATIGVSNPPKLESEGFPAWTEGDVEMYRTRWPLETKERVWIEVLLFVGCRRGDAVQIGRQHVRGNELNFITEKGRKKRRIEVTKRIEPELAEVLALGPCGDLAFICGERGEPLTKESFGNAFKAACVAAGITDKSAHGLRKLSATMWAERGATEHELMALFGWLTPQMAALYTRGAHRRKLSLNAHDRLMGTSSEQSMPSPDQKVWARDDKAI